MALPEFELPDPDKDIATWGPNERGVSHTFSAEIVKKFN